jgi:hypothetical protein
MTVAIPLFVVPSEIAAMIAGVSALLLFFLAVIVSVISTVANILLDRPLRAAFGFGLILIRRRRRRKRKQKQKQRQEQETDALGRDRGNYRNDRWVSLPCKDWVLRHHSGGCADE